MEYTKRLEYTLSVTIGTHIHSQTCPHDGNHICWYCKLVLIQYLYVCNNTSRGHAVVNINQTFTKQCLQRE